MKNGAKETRHLVGSADAATTLCGRPVGKVVLWAKKSEPGDKDTVCGRCKALKKGNAQTARIVKKHQAIREAGEKKAPAENKPGKRQPALLVLGDRMPDEMRVTFKGKESLAAVKPDGTILVEGHEQTFNSPSRAGKAVAGREVDGWTFWSYLKADGTLEKIDALRKAVAR
jgi:hypothetical protein